LQVLALLTFLTETGKQKLEKELLSRYDLRVASYKDPNNPRTQIIGVCNTGGEEADALIKVRIKKNPSDPINDFSAVNYDPGSQEAIPSKSQISFVARLKQVEALKRLKAEETGGFKSEPEKWSALYEVDLCLEILLNNKLRKAVNPTAMETIRQRFDQIRRELREQTIERWKTEAEASRVIFIPPAPPRIGQIEQLEFELTLKADKQKFILIRSGPEEMENGVEFNSSRPKNEVSPGDLRISDLGMLWRYDQAGRITILFIVLPLLVFYSYSVIKRLKPRPPYFYFNCALETDDQRYWDEAADQYQEEIEARFQQICLKRRKKPGSFTPKSRFDYVRNRMIDKYGRQIVQAQRQRAGASLKNRLTALFSKPVPVFGSQEELDDAIKKFLDEYVGYL
jgi:hypothetical protein